MSGSDVEPSPTQTESEVTRLAAAMASLEAAIAAGNTALFPVLRRVTVLHSEFTSDAFHDPEHGPDAYEITERVGQLADCIRVLADVSRQPALAKRARVLCADLLSFQIDGNLQDHASYLHRLQLEARSILTGESTADLSS